VAFSEYFRQPPHPEREGKGLHNPLQWVYGKSEIILCFGCNGSVSCVCKQGDHSPNSGGSSGTNRGFICDCNSHAYYDSGSHRGCANTKRYNCNTIARNNICACIRRDYYVCKANANIYHDFAW
jgi:hypothetical protein